MENINYQSKTENIKSINSLLNSQSCILSTLKNIYCCDFNTELVCSNISSEEKILLLTQFMDLLACKEESTTKLIDSICCFMNVDCHIENH